jgi:hypothetical protein
MAQMKPTISRAIAVVTTTFGLPAAARRRNPHYSFYCSFRRLPVVRFGRAIRIRSFTLSRALRVH